MMTKWAVPFQVSSDYGIHSIMPENNTTSSTTAYRIKQLLRHSGVYGFFDFLSKATSLILIPLYTHHLTVADYGKLEILTQTGSFFIILLVLGMNSALVRYYIHFQEEEQRKSLVSTCLWFTFFVSTVFTLLLFACSGLFSQILFSGPEETIYFKYVFIAVCFDAISAIFLAVLRAREKSFTYSSLLFVKFVSILLLNIYLVGVAQKGITGILVSSLVGAAVLLAGNVFLLGRELSLRFSKNKLQNLLSFGLPLVPGAFGLIVLSISDRYFLKYFADSHEVGLYALGYKISMIMGILVRAFQVAWPPVLFSIEKDHDAQSTYSRVLTYLLFVSFGLFVILGTFSKELVRLLSTAEYFDAYKVVPIVLMAYMFYGVYYAVSVGINLKNKTKYIPPIVGGAAIINLMLNYLMIPAYGMMGAAVATVLSYALMAMGTYYVSNRLYPIRYEYARIA
ncbi:MAG: flippase, partial [Deltaproteobacteria bacterium]|nr:flippase [Deltaproteobacteria bacterium]